MVSQRTKAIGLLALGVIGLLVAVWWFVWPWVRESGKARQPAPVVSTGPTTGSPVTPGISSSAKQAPDANSPEEKERQAQERLKQQASEFVVMVGTFSQADEFDALREAGLQTTKDLHGFLSKQRATLMAAHSRFGPSWGQTTRAISARLISGTPLLSSSSAEVMVQAQREVGSINGDRKTSYEEVTVTFQKSGALWVASRLESKPYEF